MAPRRLLLVVRLGGAALLLGAACLPVPALLRQSVLIDDTFYSLAAARHLAAGDGSTVDGIHATNGYQPLWVWILAGATRLGALGPDGTVRAALLLCALGTLSTGVLLVRLVRSLGGSETAAAWTAALWLLNPYLLRRQVNGLETSLATLLLVATVAAAIGTARGVDGEGRAGGATDGGTRALKLGILAGLAGLARVDLLVLMPLLALRRRWVAALTAGIMAAPWIIWSWARFRSLVPLSGEANRVLYRVLRGFPEGSWTIWDPGNVSWTVASLPGLGWPAAALEKLGCRRAFVWLVVPAAAGIVWPAIASGGSLRERLWAWWEGIRPLAFWCGALAAFLGVAYALFYPAPWHLNRYFLPLHALLTVCAALFFDRIVTARGRATPDPTPPAARSAPASGEGDSRHARPSAWRAGLRERLWWVLWCAGMTAGFIPYFIDTTGGLQPALGLEVARWIREDVPPGVRIGVLQSGVVGYYAGRPIVNLDGKVNPEAMRAVRHKTMGEYLRRERVEIFGDWSDLVGRCVFGRAGAEERALRRLAEPIPPGADGLPPLPFAFYRLRR